MASAAKSPITWPWSGWRQKEREREPRTLTERRERKTKIVPHIAQYLPPAHPRPAPSVDDDAGIAHLLPRAEAALGFCAGGGGRPTHGQEIPLVHLEVEAQLGVDLLADIGLPKPQIPARGARLLHRAASSAAG